MRNYLHLICISVLSLFCSHLSFAQTTYTLNWASSFSPAWADAATSGTASNIGGSGINCTVTMTPSGGVFSTNGGGFNTPTVGNTAFVVGGSSANNQIDMQFSVNTQFTDIIYTFSGAISNVKFNIADLDKVSATAVSYYDKVIVTGANGSQVYNPVIAKYVPSSTYLIAAGNSANASTASGTGGNSASSAADQLGSVTVDFGTAVLKTVTIRYTNAIINTTNPDVSAKQAIGIGNLSFQKINTPPVANNFTNQPTPQGNAVAAIPGLSATDADGTIASYTLTSVPTAAQGTISIPCPATPTSATCTGGFADLTPAVLTANSGAIVITPVQAAGIRFKPVANFSGNAVFTFTATDNTGLVSNTANFTLPVTSQPPVANNIMESAMVNTLAATAIDPLSASDIDGTIASYQITTVPPPAQGVLSVPCPPNLLGGTCTGGFEDLTSAVLSNYPSGIPLNATQAAGLRFDPAAGYTGSAVFNYNAVDNSGNTSNTANYTIPVSATASNSRPPVADNVNSQTLNNSLSNTSIPALQGSDLNGSVVSYTVTSIPSAAAGVLRIACPNSTPLTCTGGFADITAGTVLLPADIVKLFFDPAATFVGTASFTYTATDNSNAAGNTATYSLPIVNTPPVSSNITTTVPFNSTAASIPALQATDADGTITGYSITSVPTALQGTLSVPCPPTITGAGACVGGLSALTPAVLTANSNNIPLTPTQAAGMKFTPVNNFTGSVPFTYTSTDNNSNVSSPANYTITIAAQPPVTADITNASIANTATNTSIAALSATDADGTIASYTISTIPLPASGVLRISCPNSTALTCTAGFSDIIAGTVLTPADVSKLFFDPAAGAANIAVFTYLATDNQGYTSNTSNYYIPVTGTGNIPPVAKNVQAATISNTSTATTIAGLVGTDADGTIASYTLTSLPDAAQGVISITCPATPTGATCTGGFANLTAAVLTANPAGIVLTTAQAAAMRFTPAAGFAGPVNFTYITTDNAGGVSTNANYNIPVTSTAPVASAVTAPAVSHSAAAAAVPALSVTDADGTVASYSLETVPPAAQGTLSVSCVPLLTGATCTGGFQDLTPAVLANYTGVGGIPLTPAQMASLRFAPAAAYVGTVVFNYHGTDNSNLISNSTTYSIPVTGLSPVSSEVRSQKITNTTIIPTTIPALSSADPDGTISSYIITSVPPSSQGTISISCPPTPAGATCVLGFTNLTAAVLTANPGGIVLTAAQAGAIRYLPTSSFTGNAVFNYAAYDNNGNLSNTAAYIIQTGTTQALPLTLTGFSGTRSGDDVQLKWETKNEINVDRFDVEYSTDGVSFTYAGSVTANNNPTGNYQFTVVSFTQPVGYFRLKSVDKDAAFTYSAVVTVRYSGKLTKAMMVTPNPATEYVQLKISSDVSVMSDIQVMSGVGQVLYHSKQQVYKGDNIVQLQSLAGRLTKGTYLVRAVIGGQVLTTKFVLQK